MRLSAYLQCNLANERTRISAVIVENSCTEIIEDVDLNQLTRLLQLVNYCSNNKCRAPFTQVCLTLHNIKIYLATAFY